MWPRKPATKEPAPLINPWQTPPLGAAGDAWDAVDELPRDPVLPTKSPVAPSAFPGERIQAVRPDQVKVLKVRRMLHPLIVAAWVFNVMALTSTRPVDFLRLPLAGVGFLCAAIGLAMVRTHRETATGYISGSLAIAAATGLVAYQLLAG